MRIIVTSSFVHPNGTGYSLDIYGLEAEGESVTRLLLQNYISYTMRDKIPDKKSLVRVSVWGIVFSAGHFISLVQYKYTFAEIFRIV